MTAPNCSFTYILTVDLAAVRFPLVQTIDLSICQRLGNQQLAELSLFHHLSSVSLDGCEAITDEGLVYLLDVEGLRQLSLRNCCKVLLKLTAALDQVASLACRFPGQTCLTQREPL